MKTLYLVRHAKSGWDDPGLQDHDRPLDMRGERAALVVGRYAAQRRFVPNLVLCSSARRSRDTLELILTQWPKVPTIEIDRDIYLVGEHGLRKRLGKVGHGISSVMVVGHNPDLHDLALRLAGKGDDALRDSLREKFPTASLAALKLPIDDWADIPANSATLIAFASPKLLV
ncbi:MAG: histidine phosphatase family protein [Rhodospirillaceae bacterium]|nr:histidine phosphatase family protein [Rhodospirillaceae bacterium]